MTLLGGHKQPPIYGPSKDLAQDQEGYVRKSSPPPPTTHKVLMSATAKGGLILLFQLFAYQPWPM